MQPTDRRRLNRADVALTRVGLGTASIGGLFTPCSEADARATLEHAWAAGIRYFDTAPFYGFGRAESRLGAFLAEAPEPCTLSTKVGRILEPVAPEDIPDENYADPLPFAPRFDYTYDGIMRSYAESLERLGGRRPEILYVHDIGPYTHGAAAEGHYRDLMEGGMRALDELKSRGDARAVGFGVNEVGVCERALADCDLDVILLAGRYSLLDRSAEAGFLETCRTRGVDLVVGGVFNSGVLATGAREGARFDYGTAGADVLDRVRRLESICDRHGVALPTASLHFPLREPAVAALLLGTAQAGELDRNLAALAEPVPDALWPEADTAARAD